MKIKSCVSAAIVVTASLVACSTAEPDSRGEGEKASVVTTLPRHGVWVYGVNEIINSPTEQDEFMRFVRCYGVDNVYLSVGGGLVNNPNLPAFLDRLIGNGVRADALLGGKTYEDIDGALAGVLAYNSTRADDEGFKGVHLDLEPWIGTGSDTSWIDPLIDDYHTVATKIGGRGLPLVADVAGFKMADLATAQQKQAMLDSVTRLILMQYSTSYATVLAKTNAFLANVVPSEAHGILVAIRAVDFPASVKATASDLDAKYASTAGYRGWAIYDYAAASAPSQTAPIPNCELND